MKKRVAFLTVIVMVLACFSAFTLVGCGEPDNSDTMIVYLGDSIAEAILGPSPLSERENYGYYALVGKRNGYTYVNRSVSGHQTKHMLEYLYRTDPGPMLTQAYIEQADIIHVSMLGNDVLQNDLSELTLEMANNDYTNLDAVLTTSLENFTKIVARIRELNPTAVLMFQKVYNPIFPTSPIISASAMQELRAMGKTDADLRVLGDMMLNRLNKVMDDYLAAHPGAFHVIDVQAEFSKIYAEDATRGQNLIYPDGVHPSNYGHAVMADSIQAKLEELGLAKAKPAIKSYKKLRIEQLERMFAETVDVAAVKKEINNAESCGAVTELYFAAIAGKTPVYC